MLEIAPVDLVAARRYARALARYACGGIKGRGKLDPVYIGVTQGRDSRTNWKHYSSCGDLLHWHAERMGVDAPWINRDRKDPPRHWEFLPGHDNIAKLQYPGPARVTPVNYLPEPGDYLLCWNTGNGDVHVRIAGNAEAGVLETFDYGAGGMSNSEFPGASCGRVKLVTNGGHLALESLRTHAVKRVAKVIPLPVILALAGDRRPSLTGEEIDELEARVT